MTRFLSEALGAIEPFFSKTILQLEHAAGRPSADIRLTTDIMQQTRLKIAQLGLDPADTTGPEFYGALQARLANDESIARQALGLKSGAAPDDVVASAAQFMARQKSSNNCFALKPSVAKRLLRKRPPKNAMKRLGYRSADSLLKHESPAAVLAAALIAEPNSWRRAFYEQYSRLAPGDFEPRKIAIIHPSTERWRQLAHDYAAKSRHNLLGFPELGAIVLLPIGQEVRGLAIVTVLLLAEELNRIRSHSSYLKLQQVKSDFGKIVQKSSTSEPRTSARLAGQPVSWRTIQRYYARFRDAYHPEVFEPHVQSDDLCWECGEDVLARLDPQLAFWQGTSHLGLLHESAIVSCNALDVALGCCNGLSFQGRITYFGRESLWHELMVRYLHQENLEAAVRRQLAGELVEQH